MRRNMRMIVRMKNKIHPYDKTGARACGCYPRGSRGYEIAGMEAFPDGCPAEPHCWPGRHNHWRRISACRARPVKHLGNAEQSDEIEVKIFPPFSPTKNEKSC